MAYEKGLLALFYPPKRGIASRECPGRSNSTVSCSTLCVKPKLPARLVECYSGSKGHIPHWLRTRIFFHFCFRVLDVSDLKLVRTECERVMWQSRPHSRKRRTSKGARNSAPRHEVGKPKAACSPIFGALECVFQRSTKMNLQNLMNSSVVKKSKLSMYLFHNSAHCV